MRILTCLTLYIGLATATLAQPATTVGFRSLPVPGIEAVALYPTAALQPTSLVADNQLFVGVEVIKDAPLDGAAHPVALLSHGFSGLWRNQAWLAERLAQAGYIVVAFNQPGTSFADVNPAWATDLSLRPQQVSRVLDALLANAAFGPQIDQKHIAVIGHSLGGATALLLAGGVFEPERLLGACADSTTKLVCTGYRKGGMTATTPIAATRDPRISAAVFLGMEGIRAFNPASLTNISIPVLALTSAVEDPALPLAWEGRSQSALLPAANARYAEIIGATHFSFMSECKPGAVEKLEADAYVCQGETAPRAALHAEIAATVIRFLQPDTPSVSALPKP